MFSLRIMMFMFKEKTSLAWFSFANG